jgi:hypothetical protein
MQSTSDILLVAGVGVASLFFVLVRLDRYLTGRQEKRCVLDEAFQEGADRLHRAAEASRSLKVRPGRL